MDAFNADIDKGLLGFLKLVFVVLVFLASWGTAIEEWGWLLGLAFGWIPAAINAGIGFLVWPAVLVLGGLCLLGALFFAVIER